MKGLEGIRHPVLIVMFEIPHLDEVIYRAYQYGEEVPEWTKFPPSWLENPRRKWDRPQDPITLTGTVKEGFEAEARKAVNG